MKMTNLESAEFIVGTLKIKPFHELAPWIVIRARDYMEEMIEEIQELRKECEHLRLQREELSAVDSLSKSKPV